MNTRLTSKMRLELIGWLVFLTILAFIDYFDLYFFFSFRISEEEYVSSIKEEIRKVVELQENLDIDVLVHGEPEVCSHPHMS